MSIRIATPSDAAALLRIYQAYIDTPITFEAALPTEAAFAGRIADITRCYPYLVWEAQGQLLGYAYAHRFRERAACKQLDACLNIPAHTDGVNLILSGTHKPFRGL